MAAEPKPAHQPVFLSSDRLASLNDTMFGVAMTLVATSLLPSIQAHRGPPLEMLRDLRGDLATVVLSFAISDRYGVSHQQRLALSDVATPKQIRLNLFYLFLIVLLPLSTSLPGLLGSEAVRGSVVIYAAHLSLIALVNLLLWIEVRHNAAARPQIVRASMAFSLFAASLAVASRRPDLPPVLWCTVFVTAVLGHRLARLWPGE